MTEPVAPSGDPTPPVQAPTPRIVPPLIASALAGAGAVLVAVEAAFLVLYPTNYTAPRLGTYNLSVESLGVMAFVEAAVLLAAAVGLYLSPRSHLELGVVAITIALLSLYAGGGFFLGALLGYFGGMLAIFHEPEQTVAAPARPEREAAEDDPVVEADLIESGRPAPAAAADDDRSG